MGIWQLKIQSKSAAAPDLVDEILQMFKACHEPINRIKTVEQAYLCILILSDHETEVEGWEEFFLDRNQMARVAELGLGLSITVS